jgi:hypothetical protein
MKQKSKWKSTTISTMRHLTQTYDLIQPDPVQLVFYPQAPIVFALNMGVWQGVAMDSLKYH